METEKIIEAGKSALAIFRAMQKVTDAQRAQFSKLLCVLLREHPEVGELVDEDGYNIGMHAAINGMSDVANEALNNKKAARQQSYKEKYTIGMFAYMTDMPEVVSKALDDKAASLARNIDNFNLGMMIAYGGDADSYDNQYARDVDRYEECLLKAMRNHEAIMMQDEDGRNMAMLAAISGFPNASYYAVINDEKACMQQDKDGKTVPMFIVDTYVSGIPSMKPALAAAIGNEKYLLQQDYSGCNLGMYCASAEMMYLGVKETLEHPVACRQRDNTGSTIAMVAINETSDYEDLVIDAIKKNPSLIYDKNNNCWTLMDYAQRENAQDLIKAINEIKESAANKQEIDKNVELRNKIEGLNAISLKKIRENRRLQYDGTNVNAGRSIDDMLSDINDVFE